MSQEQDGLRLGSRSMFGRVSPNRATLRVDFAWRRGVLLLLFRIFSSLYFPPIFPFAHPAFLAAVVLPMSLSPGHTPQDIQNHLYRAFLDRATTDVSVNVRAKGWNVAYDLHRVVLIQSVSSCALNSQQSILKTAAISGVFSIAVHARLQGAVKKASIAFLGPWRRY